MQNKKYFLGALFSLLLFWCGLFLTNDLFAATGCCLLPDAAALGTSDCYAVSSASECPLPATFSASVCSGCNIIPAPAATTGCCKKTTASGTECTSSVASTACLPVAGSVEFISNKQCTEVAGCSATETDPATHSTIETTTFENPTTIDSADELLTSLLDALKGLVATLAVLFIVLGGILYLISGGDSTMVTRAKKCWLFSAIGFSIVIAAPTFLKQVRDILGADPAMDNGAIDPALTIKQIVENVLNFLLSIVGIIAIISFVISGIMYLTAYGDSKRLDSAKKMANWSVIGIIIALISLIVLQQIEDLIIG